MLKGKIEFEGKTLSDVLFAIETAMKSIENENTSGFDRNEDGRYSFEVEGEEDATERTWMLWARTTADVLRDHLASVGATSAIVQAEGAGATIIFEGPFLDAPPAWMAQIVEILRAEGIEHKLD